MRRIKDLPPSKLIPKLLAEAERIYPQLEETSIEGRDAFESGIGLQEANERYIRVHVKYNRLIHYAELLKRQLATDNDILMQLLQDK